MENGITFIKIGRSGGMPKAAPPPGVSEPGLAGMPSARMPLRRRFTTAYKLQMLQRAECALQDGRGELRELLAREGLSSSHLAQWRRQSREGSLQRSRRGRPALGRQALYRENARLRRKLAYLEACLREAVPAGKPPQGRGAAAHAEWILRQRLLHLADLARAARGPAPQGGPGRAASEVRGPSAPGSGKGVAIPS